MLVFLGAIAILVQASSPEATTVAPVPGAALWHDLRVGMAAEDVAAELRTEEGVKSVRITSKPNKPTRMAIDYVDKGVAIGNLIVTVTPVFERNLLSSVVLVSDVCSSEAVVNAKAISENLKAKYGSVQRMNIVDDNGVKIDEQFAFYNEETRVALSFKSRNDAVYSRVYASGKLGNSLAQLSNSMNESAAQNAINACPADRGERTTTSLVYSSQATFLSDHAKDIDERKAKADAMKNGL